MIQIAEHREKHISGKLSADESGRASDIRRDCFATVPYYLTFALLSTHLMFIYRLGISSRACRVDSAPPYAAML